MSIPALLSERQESSVSVTDDRAMPMMNRSDVIAAKTAALASEDFGGETVVIHFETGTYFSLRGSASAIWSMLQRPTSIDGIIEAIRAGGKSTPAEFPTMLEAFVTQLAAHDLVLRVDGVQMPPENSLPNGAASFDSPPTIEVYSDLAELIAMDPVHEVDTFTGWPQRAPTEQKKS